LDFQRRPIEFSRFDQAFYFWPPGSFGPRPRWLHLVPFLLLLREPVPYPRPIDSTTTAALVTMPSLPRLEYPLTMPITLPHFTLVICILGVFWTTLITILNVAAVGYDVVSVYSSSFNSSTSHGTRNLVPSVGSSPIARVVSPRS
jgi:hypothetical protein